MPSKQVVYQDLTRIQTGQILGVQRGGKRFGVREAGVSDKEAQDLSLGNC